MKNSEIKEFYLKGVACAPKQFKKNKKGRNKTLVRMWQWGSERGFGNSGTEVEREAETKIMRLMIGE